jgi:hypothetical protein
MLAKAPEMRDALVGYLLSAARRAAVGVFSKMVRKNSGATPGAAFEFLGRMVPRNSDPGREPARPWLQPPWNRHAPVGQPK